MRAGQTLVGDDGYQVCLFPLDVLNITQLSSPDSLSHCCGNPMDVVGTHTSYPIYAPCACHLISSNSAALGNNRTYQSDYPVHTPSGVGIVTFSFTHDNNPPSKTSFAQGELIGHTGTAGYASGDHVHIDQSPMAGAGLVTEGKYCRYGNKCWHLSNDIAPWLFWYINETRIINGRGKPWKEYDGGHEGEIDPDPDVPDPEEDDKGGGYRISALQKMHFILSNPRIIIKRVR